MFRNVMFVWQSMPIFNFTGYILTESFRKPDNWRRIYNQTSSTFFTSNMCLKRVEKKQLLGRHNNYICRITVCLITFKKCRSSHWICSIKKQLLENVQIQIHRKTPMLESLFNSKYREVFRSTYFEEHLRTATPENVFMKLTKKRLFISNFYIYIKETSENICFYFMKETSENACFYFMIGFRWSLYYMKRN